MAPGKWVVNPRCSCFARGKVSACLVAVSFLAAPAFLTSMLPASGVDSDKHGAMFRRRALASATLVATLMKFQALPVHAAGPPQQYLSVSGLEKPYEKANGVWQMQDGKELNKRAVYKRQGEEIYFMVNDCGEFQMSKFLTGECTGFARQVSKGKWLIDGADGKIVVKPGNSVKDAKVEVAMFETAYHPEPLLKKRVNKYSWQEIAQAGGYFTFMKDKVRD